MRPPLPRYSRFPNPLQKQQFKPHNHTPHKSAHKTPESTPQPPPLNIHTHTHTGGMRGCVGAGMLAALNHLGLRDAFDVVYGSSAGSLMGAYFLSGQTPLEGPGVRACVLSCGGCGGGGGDR